MFTPAQLEQMRQIGLRLDAQGTFWQGNAPVSHARLRTALLTWLDVLPDGRDVVRLDAQRYAYVAVAPGAPHLRATAARWDGDACHVTWDDGAEAELDYATLAVAPDDALVVRVRGGRLRGRIGGAAYQTVTERVDAVGDGYVLRARGQAWPLR